MGQVSARKSTAIWPLLLAAAMLIALLPALSAGAAQDIRINEIRIDQPGNDDDEFFELAGLGGASLAGLTYLVIGDGSGGSGVIENVTHLTGSAIPPSGFFVAAETTFTLGTADLITSLNFENSDNVTHLLVDGFTGSNGDDLDTNDDGTLDSTPWTAIVDSVALVETVGSGDHIYSANTVGPDGSFVPGHALYCLGVFPSNWAIGSFSGGDETPGADNGDCLLVLTIPEIQGDGFETPYDGEFVQTSGVVTLTTFNGSDGWIQDPAGDGNPATSDGILVDDFNTLSPTPSVGDLITIQGVAEESGFGVDQPRTQINNPVLVSIESGPSITPVPLTDLPNTSVEDGLVFWESLESMLVRVEHATVVAATSQFGEFTMLAPGDTLPNSGYFPSVDQILLRRIGNENIDYNPERILVDDNALDTPDVRPGDTVHDAVGVVDYSFGNYKLQLSDLDYTAAPLPTSPVSSRDISPSEPSNPVVITTFNVENLFDQEIGVDVIGQVGFDPGSEWGSGLTSTQDNTLRRKETVCAGDAVGRDAFDPADEWDGFPQNDISDLGSHTVTCSGATELFISEYVEGSSNNKALEIYNGTGATVDLSEYQVEVYFNGNDDEADASIIPLTGTGAGGEVFVLADDDAVLGIPSIADQVTSQFLWNGDDAVVLRKGDKADADSTLDPDDWEIQIDKLAHAIVDELELPELMILQEVENTAVAQELGDRVDAISGTTDYVAVSEESSDFRGIEVAFLYDDNRVDLDEWFQLSGADVEAAFGPGSASPGREPLYGLFDIGGAAVHVIGNHFKSKSGDDPIFGIPQPFQRYTETQRKMQAQVVRDFVDGLFADDAKALVLVAGDLNDFQFAEEDEGPDHPVGILEGIGVPGQYKLTNLVDDEVKSERFSFVFDGNSQVLDHMLISQQLRQRLTGVDFLHFNAGFPATLAGDDSTTIRSSDHDPLEARFDFD